MKSGTHPEYYPDAKIKCACGNEIKTGSTQKELAVEICSACHPFYTGVEKVVDTAGRVEKFKARSAVASATAKTAKNSKADKKAATRGNRTGAKSKKADN